MWQAQYLVRLAGDFSWQAQHFVTFWEIAGARNVVFYNTKSSSRWDREGPRSGGCEMTILCSDYRRIILGYPRIVFLLAEALQGVSAPILSFKISWQAQYLVRLEGDFTCSAHWKWRFICDADQWWHSFCVAGAVFGEVGGWLFVAGAAFRDILGDSRSAKCCILQYKIVSKMGRVRSPKRRVRDDDFILGYRRIILGLWSNRLSIGGSTSGSFRSNLELQDFVAGAVFGEVGGWLFVAGAALRDILGDSRDAKCCILQYKIVSKLGRVRSPKRRVRDDDFILGYRRIILGLWSNRLSIGGSTSGSFRSNLELQDFVAGAVFGEVGGWLYLLRALEMTFHMSRRSSMTFILRGRRSIWWSWTVILVAPRIVNDVSKQYPWG